MSSFALKRLATEARKPRLCEGVRVLGPLSDTEPLTYRVEIVGPCVPPWRARRAFLPCRPQLWRRLRLMLPYPHTCALRPFPWATHEQRHVPAA